MTRVWCNNDGQYVNSTRGSGVWKYLVFLLGFPTLTLAWWIFLLKKPHCPICNDTNWGQPLRNIRE